MKFTIETDSKLPEAMDTDLQRLNQILKNLLSNSFKFTEKGEVKLKIYSVDHHWKSNNPLFDNVKDVVAFAISDTGIGIPQEKQNIIFEAFQQAEGSTSRKYGGTGLGLSISRGLAELLGGTIELESHTGQGSIFTLFLPVESISGILSKETAENLNAYQQLQFDSDSNDIDTLLNSIRITNEGIETKKLNIVNEIINDSGDDRTNVQPNDKVVLVVEDDLRFGKIIIEKAHREGLKAIVATSYIEVFDFINRFSPIAITLDVKLTDTSGWKVLDLLRNDLNYRHIPVHLISGEENRMLALKRDARSFYLKPLEYESLNELFTDISTYNKKQVKSVLVVEENEIESSLIVNLLKSENIVIYTADTGKKALKIINSKDLDCISLDYTLPDISGLELLDRLLSHARRIMAIIVAEKLLLRFPHFRHQ